MSIPSHIKAINTVSAVLFDVVYGSTVLVGGLGAAIGTVAGKPATYALQFAITDIFWKYIQPNTFQKLFMHKASNAQARVIGASLSYAASFAIPYATNFFISQIDDNTAHNTPIVNTLKTENKDQTRPFTKIDAFVITTFPAIITFFRRQIL